MQKTKSRVNSTAKSKDNFLVYLIGAVVIGLAAISLFVWNQSRKSDYVTAPEPTYSKFGPYQVEAQNFTISATLSVQTSEDDAEWAKENQKALNTVFRKLLADNVDANTMKSPAGLQKLQDALVKGSNAELGTDRVHSVLLTDFVLQSRPQTE